MADLSSNAFYCDPDSLLCSEHLLPCLGAASRSCVQHCVHTTPLGTLFLRPQSSASPGKLAAEHGICADFMPTVEIINNVIMTGATLQASAYCSGPDSLLCVNGSVLLLRNDIR